MASLYHGIVTTLNLVLMLSVLVVVHEWGHFIVARIFKIRVDEFSLGFGPRMVRLGQRGDTEYNVRWALLGGYVKIAGMEPDEAPITNVREKAKDLLASKDPNKSEVPLLAENTADRAENEEQRRRDAIDGFYSKPGWQRALVIFAGPLMSFVLGVFIFCSLGVTTGLPMGAGNVVESITQHSPAENMGLKVGDKIVSINGQTVPNDDGQIILTVVHGSAGKPVTLTVDRKGTTLSMTGIPKKADLPDGGTGGLLGFSPSQSNILHRTGLGDSIRAGFLITRETMTMIGQKFQHLAGIAQSTGGIVEISAYTNEAAQHGPIYVLELWAELTISLALFNLLPIPILDGGHLMIIAVEGLRNGRRLTTEQQQTLMIAGLAIIGTIFVLVTTRGFYRLIEGKLPHIG